MDILLTLVMWGFIISVAVFAFNIVIGLVFGFIALVVSVLFWTFEKITGSFRKMDK